MSRVDDLYARFEDRFRGPREAILKRLETYVPLLEIFERRNSVRSAVDLGCGRGEWLQLLASRGWQARGVDMNQRMLAEAARHGVEGHRGDALAYLSSLPDRSVNVISAFHLVEHLPTELLLQLLGEAGRVLSTDGMIVLETPNPENLAVGTSSFFLDPTHEKPLPPHLLQFFVEQSRIPVAEILRVNGEVTDGTVNSLEAAVRPFFFQALDYAIVGTNAADPVLIEAFRSFVRDAGQPLPIALDGVQRYDRHMVRTIDGLATALEKGMDETRDAVLESRETLRGAIVAVHNGVVPLHEQLAAFASQLASIQHAWPSQAAASEARLVSLDDRVASLAIAVAGVHDAVEEFKVLFQARLDERIGESSANLERLIDARISSGLADVMTAMDERQVRLAKSNAGVLENFQKAIRESNAVARIHAGAHEQRMSSAIEGIARTFNELVEHQVRLDELAMRAKAQTEQAVSEAIASTTATFHESTSWRVTKPLRAISGVVKREPRHAPGAVPLDGSPPARGWLGHPLLWRTGRMVIRLIPGARKRMLEELDRRSLLTHPLVLSSADSHLQAQKSRGADERFDYESDGDVEPLPRPARALQARIVAAQKERDPLH